MREKQENSGVEEKKPFERKKRNKSFHWMQERRRIRQCTFVSQFAALLYLYSCLAVSTEKALQNLRK